MNETVKAHSPDEVAAKFGYSFYTGTTQPELDERVQLGKLLLVAAETPLLRYPLEVTHTRDRKPDFRLAMGSTFVGVEATKVANERLEQARVLHRERGLGTICISSYLKEPSERRTREQDFKDSFLMSSFVMGNTIEDEDEFWIKQAEKILRRKADIFRRSNFERQQENWLLLWDKLRSSDWDLQRRIPMLSALLQEFWGHDWFSKVILEQNQFQCLVILSQDGVTWLEGHSAF